jgi:hypothetical protein
MTAAEFRKIALSIPEVIESQHMDHPDFRVRGKVFASLGAPDEEWGMVKLSPADQRSFMEKAPEIFTPCNGAWGRQGCTNVHLASANKTTLRTALAAAAKNVPAPARKKRA